MSENNLESSGRMIIGITGPSGAGKSAAARILAAFGAAVVDCDAISREVSSRPEVIAKIAKTLGSWSVGDDGALDRSRVAGVVFRSPKDLAALTRITHKYIIDEVDAMARDFRGGRVPGTALVIDAPIPVKRGFIDLADAVWAIVSTPRNRIARIIARDGVTMKEATARVGAQMSDADYVAAAGTVIANDGEFYEFEKNIKKAWDNR